MRLYTTLGLYILFFLTNNTSTFIKKKVNNFLEGLHSRHIDIQEDQDKYGLWFLSTYGNTKQWITSTRESQHKTHTHTHTHSNPAETGMLV